MNYALIIALWLNGQYTEFRVPVSSLAACREFLTQRMKSPQGLKDNVLFYCERMRAGRGHE